MEKGFGSVSTKTSQRWWLVGLLTVFGLGVLASSIYFMIIPVGYQGGRNPYYAINLLFGRDTWDAVHLWTGLSMIFLSIVHIFVHWKWIKTMAVHCFKPQVCVIGKNNWRAQYNIALDLFVAVSFLLASVSGMYLMVAPSRSASATAPVILLNRDGWDVVHTWSGIAMFISVFLHFYIHWGWIANVTKKVVGYGKLKQNLKLDGVKND